MPNSLTKNPWVVDTASATAISTEWVYIRSIQWIGGAVSGDEAVVADQNDRVIWRRLAQGANQDFETVWDNRMGGQADGLQVPTLTSGTIYITFARGGR